MSWLYEVGKPLCPTREEAERFMMAELQHAMPPGWRVERLPGDTLAWTLLRNDVPPGQFPQRDYGVRLTAGLDFVLFTHGNSDSGTFSLRHALQRALIIEAAAVRHFGMAACVQQLLAECEPNAWGYT